MSKSIQTLVLSAFSNGKPMFTSEAREIAGVGRDNNFKPFTATIGTLIKLKLLKKTRTVGVTAEYQITAAGKKEIEQNPSTWTQDDLAAWLNKPRAYGQKKQSISAPPSMSPLAMQAIGGITDLVHQNEQMYKMLVSIHSQIGKVLETYKPTEKQEQEQDNFELE